MEPSKSPKSVEATCAQLRLVTGLQLPGLPPDRLAERLRWAVILSIVVNAGVWMFVARVVHTHVVAPPTIITIQRVFINKDHKIEVIKPKPRVKPHPKPRPVPARMPPPRMRTQTPPPPQVHVMTTTAAPSPEATAAPGGDAQPGNVNASPPQPTPTPTPEPQPAPIPPPTPVPTPPAAEPKPTPAPDPVVVAPPPPAPVAPPAPVGPTQDAEPDNEVKPDIPDDLKQSDFKTSVRVKVIVESDGTFTPVLRTSSGSAEIDQRLMVALKQWRWKPALKDGQAVESTTYFRFDFVVD